MAGGLAGVQIDLEVGGDVEFERRIVLTDPGPDILDGGVRNVGRSRVEISPTLVRTSLAVEVQIDHTRGSGPALQRNDAVLIGRDRNVDGMIRGDFLRLFGLLGRPDVTPANHLIDGQFGEQGGSARSRHHPECDFLAVDDDSSDDRSGGRVFRLDAEMETSFSWSGQSASDADGRSIGGHVALFDDAGGDTAVGKRE